MAALLQFNEKSLADFKPADKPGFPTVLLVENLRRHTQGVRKKDVCIQKPHTVMNISNEAFKLGR